MSDDQDKVWETNDLVIGMDAMAHEMDKRSRGYGSADPVMRDNYRRYHFRAKYSAKEIPRLRAEIVALREARSERDLMVVAWDRLQDEYAECSILMDRSGAQTLSSLAHQRKVEREFMNRISDIVMNRADLSNADEGDG